MTSLIPVNLSLEIPTGQIPPSGKSQKSPSEPIQIVIEGKKAVANSAKSDFISLPADVQALILSFLPFGELRRPINKGLVTPLTDHALDIRIQGSSFLQKIERNYLLKFGKAKNPSTRFRNIWLTAARVLRKGAPLSIHKESQACSMPIQRLSRDGQFNPMFLAIRNRRIDNRIAFFDFISSRVPEAKEFSTNLPPELTGSERAGQMMQWIKDNKNLLGGIRDISELHCRNAPSLPIEIVELENLNYDEILLHVCSLGNLEPVSEIVSRHRDRLSGSTLAMAFVTAIEKGFFEIALALISFNPEYLLPQALTKAIQIGNSELFEELFRHPELSTINEELIIKALFAAGNEQILRSLLNGVSTPINDLLFRVLKKSDQLE